MFTPLTGRTVLVTGGTKGIGEGCVRVFVEAGSRVAFCARDGAAGATLAREVTARGPGEASFLRCDVSRASEVEALVYRVMREHFPLEVNEGEGT